MKRFLSIILILMPLMCSARVLRIGDLAIPLYAEKVTTPSINIAVDNTVLYAPLIPQNMNGTVHIGQDNTVFSVPIYNLCTGENRYVNHYWFVGDCLVGADDKVYLESTGTQYIDTGYKPWAQSFGYYFDLIVYDNNEPQIYTLAGSYEFWNHGEFAAGLTGNYPSKYLGYDALGSHCQGWEATAEPVAKESCINIGQRGFVSVYNNNDYNGVYSTLTTQCSNLEPYVESVYFSPDVQSNNNWCLYGIDVGGSCVELANARMYRVILYEYFRPVRYFVPVPAGMRIGNYTVPSNGMWDTVEQKFYGNSGTGNFIYGVDE